MVTGTCTVLVLYKYRIVTVFVPMQHVRQPIKQQDSNQGKKKKRKKTREGPFYLTGIMSKSPEVYSPGATKVISWAIIS